jgi:hypothetical protein
MPLAVGTRADEGIVYGVSAVGEAGRISDRPISSALAWPTGKRLDIECVDEGVLLIRPTTDGEAVVSAGGYF